jgi:16S rRNA (cytidine1402-2'-O)-methyltransferase
MLKEVDLILAEDTRTSRKLLDHYGIETPLKSYHAHNEHGVVPHFVEQMKAGTSIALITDAGTPGISDPGFLLVRACKQADIPVTCLPGPTAFVPAIASSGIPSDKFYFEGFLPHKKGRQTRLQFLAQLDYTFVLYESPFRLTRCLNELMKVCGPDRQVCVARELSKLYESVITGTIASLLEVYKDAEKVKGEIVIVVEGKDVKSKNQLTD